ncbi:MAG: hypothetical protein EOO23_05200 [Comamonadaceae bacterium]|nr:MAG: hypothetical protein EOO23_05200 [Comamonadaceae bacterium]
MKAVLLIVAGYLVGCLAGAAVSFELQPLHAHVPIIFAYAFSPLLPLAWVADLFSGSLSRANGIALGVFVLVMCASGYLARRAWIRAAQ